MFVVKDHKRFLRNTEIIQAETHAGCDQIASYPKCSPDFNAIEGWWCRLKMHLEEHAPAAMRIGKSSPLEKSNETLEHTMPCRGAPLV